MYCNECNKDMKAIPENIVFYAEENSEGEYCCIGAEPLCSKCVDKRWAGDTPCEVKEILSFEPETTSLLDVKRTVRALLDGWREDEEFDTMEEVVEALRTWRVIYTENDALTEQVAALVESAKAQKNPK